jgi:hypothetical protein
MKKIQKGVLVILIAASVAVYSCGPTDDKNSMDEENSAGEGALDSTRIPNFDSTTTQIGADTTATR